LQNKLRAISILRARLYEMEEQKRQAELEADRRSQVGMGDRSEKIRTSVITRKTALTRSPLGYSAITCRWCMAAI